LVRDSQRIQQCGHRDAARRIDRIHGDAEMGGADGFDIDVFEGEDTLHVPVDGIVDGNDLPHLVHWSVLESAGLDAGKNLAPIFGGQKFAAGIQQLQGIPFDRVVGRREYDAAVAALPGHHHLHRGGRG
jgi:hypothetical protein